MPPSYGYWIAPKTGQSYPVTRHQDWILENAAVWGLQAAVLGLNAERDEDLIRLLGCQAGLVRVRDYGPRMSVQFWEAVPEKVGPILRAISKFLPEIGTGPLKSIWIHNLATGDQTTLTAETFLRRMQTERSVFGPPTP